MNKRDDKLREALLEALWREEEQLEEELKEYKPHIFSEEFEEKMRKLLSIEKENK